MKVEVSVSRFYPEVFRRKGGAERYQSKGTCEVHLLLDTIEMDVRNITYRIDHEGKITLKPPFRVHSNKKAGIKPRLVPSVVFKEAGVWQKVESKVKCELLKGVGKKVRGKWLQLEFWVAVA